MARVQGIINELFETGEGQGISVGLATPLNFVPGQYFRAAVDGSGEVLPQIFFPIQKNSLNLTLEPLREGRWQPGQEISLRGPLGNGFQMPAAVEHVGLISFGSANAALLLPLAAALLAEGKDVALATAAPLRGLPPALEVLPPEQAQDVTIWADGVAISAWRNDLGQVIERFRGNGSRKLIQVLVQTDMPCGGVAACGVCALPTKKGWKLTCKDGPVFVLGELAAE